MERRGENILKRMRSAGLILLLSLLGACQKLPYIPDENAVIFLDAVPASISRGATSRISIHGEKGNGYPLPDGTVVFLSASRGVTS